jgi:hypothetical protein
MNSQYLHLLLLVFNLDDGAQGWGWGAKGAGLENAGVRGS